MKRLKKTGIILIFSYILLVLLAYMFQDRLIFIPSRMPANHTYDYCQSFDEFYLRAEDGAKLNAVHIKSERAKGVVLYFHGNSGNIANLNHVVNLIDRKGYDAILVDYRTYGKSVGKMSEKALKEDAQLFYNYALTQYDEDEIVLYGQSFGTGIATGLAAANRPKKVILESPFYSAVALGRHRFPFLPIEWLSRYRFPSNEYVKLIKCPIFIFHGTDDSVIPFQQAVRLYNAITGKSKKLFRIEGGGHNYLQDFDTFKKGMDEVLD